MTYAKQDDGFHEDPRYAALELTHLGLIACARSYMARHLTDGRIPAAILRRFGATGGGETLVTKLVDLGVWEQDGDHYVDRHYLEHNATRAEVEERKAALSEVRRAAGAKGGRRSGESRRQSNQASQKQVASKQTKQNEALSSPILSSPLRSNPDQREEIAPSAPLTLTGEPPTRSVAKLKKAPKHTPEEIAAKTAVLDHFVERFEAVKGCKPKSLDAGDNAAAFRIAKVYGVYEANAIIDRAFEDPFVVEKNATIKFIASKADTYRGTAALSGARTRNPVQRQPIGGSAWTSLAAKEQVQ